MRDGRLGAEGFVVCSILFIAMAVTPLALVAFSDPRALWRALAGRPVAAADGEVDQPVAGAEHPKVTSPP